MQRIAWILVGSFLLVACGDDDPVEPPPPPPPPPTDYVWEADLVGEEGWEQLSGSATVEFTEDETEFDATAQIAGDEDGAVRPWHVHVESCEVGGGIVGDDLDYPRLEVGVEGTAEASVTIMQALDPEAAYHVNVHLDEDLTIIMCGDLILQP